MRIPSSIIAGFLILAGAMAFLFRFEIVQGPGNLPLRLDRWTGELVACSAKTEPGSLVCGNAWQVVSQRPSQP